MIQLTLEIAVFNISSALAAAAAGADRIELCENPHDGGTTPSYGTLQTVKEKVQLPVFPIIRPRGGDFLYDDEEFEVMKKDIRLVRQTGYEGVVLGLLDADGRVDVERTTRLVELAYPMEVTYHRAFDRAADPHAALEDIIRCGCQRILTSGQVPEAWEGRALIKTLVEEAAGRIIIMPGSGVRAGNIEALRLETRAEEFHSSARRMMPGQMRFKQTQMRETIGNISVDPDEIRAMKTILQKL